MFKPIGDWLNRYGGWMSLIGLILTVVGGGGLLSYLWREYAQISYTSSTVKIVSQVRPSIKITSATGDPIDANVYVTDLAIWNSGNQTIEKDQIRNAITIGVDNELVQIEKSKENTQSAHFELEKVPDVPNARYLNWKFFDPDYGARIALVTAGDHPPNVEVGGEIYRVDIVPVMDPLVVANIRSNLTAVSLFVLLLFLVAGFIWIYAHESRVKLTRENLEAYTQNWIKTLSIDRYLFIILFIMNFILLVDYTWIEMNLTTPVPPMLADL